MNLSRVLDSLPEAPSTRFREKPFRFNPQIFHREEVVRGETTIYALTKSNKVYSFTPQQWALVKLFDGRRSYEEIGKVWRRTTGGTASDQAIRQYAEMLDQGAFWYKTAEEENTALMRDVVEAREKLVRKEKQTIKKVYVFVYDADKEVSWAYKKVSWMYKPVFVISSLVAIALMIGLWIARWNEVFSDSVLYWNMTNKTVSDLLLFYVIFLIVGFFHESGHALTAKHFGAGVHRTGLMLVYTVPAFFVNLSEVWAYGGPFARICAILGGFWVEWMLCAVATLVWWGSAIGSPAHEIAYKFILVGGIMPVLFNMNPLVPLDGYLVTCELIRIHGLKEKATSFLSSWVQHHVFRLPVTFPVLPRSRATMFALYAFLSGIYTYSMSLFLARLIYRFGHNYSPDWAFLPSTIVAFLLFKKRIVKFFKFVETVYLDKKDLMWTHRKKVMVGATAGLALALLPLWRETVHAPFVLEAAERSVIRAEVPGRVDEVLAHEGSVVQAGTRVLRLDNVQVRSEAALASSEANIAATRAREAQVRYSDYGAAQAELQQKVKRAQIARDRERHLTLTAPISGIVLTPHTESLAGSWVTEGTEMLEVADETSLRARIFVSEGDMRTMNQVSGQSLLLESRVRPLHGEYVGISPFTQEVSPGLEEKTAIKGLAPPPHYVAVVLLNNADGSLRSGMSGEAKIFGARRSLIGLAGRPILDFIGRKLW